MTENGTWTGNREDEHGLALQSKKKQKVIKTPHKAQVELH
jgi:hypothetical protein